MKYRDLITIFVSILFISSVGFAIGVAKSTLFWSIPVILLAALVVIYYKLWK